MFQFPRFPLTFVSTSCEVGFPIRTLSDRGLIPAPRDFSQVIASFIGSSAKASTVDPCSLDLLLGATTGARGLCSSL